MMPLSARPPAVPGPPLSGRMAGRGSTPSAARPTKGRSKSFSAVVETMGSSDCNDVSEIPGPGTPVWVTPTSKKRSRRPSQRSSSGSTLQKADPRPDVALNGCGASDCDLSSAAVLALKTYRAASFAALQEYRTASVARRTSSSPAPVARHLHASADGEDSPPSSPRWPRLVSGPSCDILTGSGPAALIQTATDSIAKLWCDAGPRGARVLVLATRANLLLWYIVTGGWSRDLSIPLRALRGDAARSVNRLLDAGFGPVGVCLAIDALGAHSRPSYPVAPPSSTVQQFAAASTAPPAITRSRKKRRLHNDDDDDDSGNEAAKNNEASAYGWDLIVVDGAGESVESTIRDARTLFTNALGVASPPQLLLLCDTPLPGMNCKTSNDQAFGHEDKPDPDDSGVSPNKHMDWPLATLASTAADRVRRAHRGGC